MNVGDVVVTSKSSTRESASSGVVARTPTDPGKAMPTTADTVIRLRIWGSHDLYKLELDKPEITIGTESTCTIRIAGKHVSKLHASLRREGDQWRLRDLASRNGTRVGGLPITESPISPGSEISIGRVTLVAESMRSIVLRTFLGRVLGWADEHLEEIDLALRAVRVTAARRAPLAVSGEDDLVSVAFDIHQLAFGAARPFILCDPTRSAKERMRRGVRMIAAPAEAVVAATGGTLCVWAIPKRLPPNFDALRKSLVKPGATAQLVICAREERFLRGVGVEPIVVSPLRARDGEIEQIIRSYAADAAGSLQTGFRLISKDLQWVLEHGQTLGEIQRCCERLLALKHFGRYTRAAKWLEISSQSLTEWMEARDIIGIPY